MTRQDTRRRSGDVDNVKTCEQPVLMVSPENRSADDLWNWGQQG